VGRAVIIDTSRHMEAIVELDPRGRTARVQPGVVQDDLNRAAAKHGLLLRPGHLDQQPRNSWRHDRQ